LAEKEVNAAWHHRTGRIARRHGVPRIEEVTLHRRTIPLKRPFVTAIRTAYSIGALLVEVRDSDGRSGWGEAPTSWRVTGESVESVTAAVLGPLSEIVMGRSSREPGELSEALERSVVRNSAARSALDCALYDLAARDANVPLFRYLGGSATQVRTDMTLSAVIDDADLESICRAAIEFANSGLRTLKIKVGSGGDDVRTVISVREAVGPEVRLRLDANQGWTSQTAIRIISSLEDAGVGLEFVEQPVNREDTEGLAYVASQVETPVMADEAVWTTRDLREIVRLHAADMINIKLAKTGGLREALELARLARENDVTAIVGCMAESHVGIAAAGALASAMGSEARGESFAHDLDGGLLLAHNPVEGGVDYDGDQVALSGSPGTGILGLSSES
jgi:L-alanine-DL-glutamate epimerase-like enolase superfamily enzyme